jgi:hypothetical protein
MSSLVEVLYPLPDLRRTPLSTIRWWESRRLVFNKVVGAVGVGSLGCMTLIDALPPRPVFMALDIMLVGVAMFIALANVCYTFGWMTELLARCVWGRSAPNLGPLLFRQGLIFAAGLTLLPLFLSAIFWMVRIIDWIVP